MREVVFSGDETGYGAALCRRVLWRGVRAPIAVWWLEGAAECFAFTAIGVDKYEYSAEALRQIEEQITAGCDADKRDRSPAH